jgi:hypothetical protein
MQYLKLASILAVCACFLAPAVALSDSTPPAPAPTPTLPELASENRFVNAVTADLQSRFATTAQAAAAGYFRYNNEDKTGAISWVNTSYWTSDPKHPGQLWYDVNGRLIGADFTVPKTDNPPILWGVSALRWLTQEQHVHFGVKQPDGSIKFGGYGENSAAKIGADLAKPTPDDVVKLGRAQTVSQVAFVFPFPAIWDLQVWLVPNPSGPFAEYNPNVKPSGGTKGM